MVVRRSIFWSFVGDGSMIVSSFITGVIVARLLTPAEMGVFAIAISVMAVLQSMSQMGLGSYVIRERAIDPVLMGSIVSIAALQGLLTSAVLCALAPLVGSFQRSGEVTEVIYIIAAVPLFSSLEAVAVGLWSKTFNFVALARVAIARAVLQTGLTVWLAVQGWGAASMAYGFLVSSIFACVLSLPPLLPVRLNVTHWRQLMRFGGLWMLLGGIRTLNARLPEFALGRLAGLAASGLYNRASASVDLVFRGGFAPLAKVLLPALAQEHENSGELGAGIIRLSGTLSAVFWPILATLALLSEEFVTVLYGDQWHAAANIVSILCAWLALAVLAAGGTETLLVLDRLDLLAKIEIARTCVGIAFIVVFAPLGMAAIAWSRVLENALFVLPYVLVFQKLGGLSVRSWISAHVESGKICFITVAPLVALITTEVLPHNPFLRLAIAGPIFVIAFLAAVYATRHPLSKEVTMIASLVAKRVHRRPPGPTV